MPSKSPVQIKIVPSKAFEIKENGKYLLVFDRDNTPESELINLNSALKSFFGKTPVIALFVKDLTSVKIAELLKDGE